MSYESLSFTCRHSNHTMTSPQQIIQSGWATYAADFDMTLSATDAGNTQVQFKIGDGQNKIMGSEDSSQDIGLDRKNELEQKTYINKLANNEGKGSYYICQLCTKAYNSEEAITQHDCKRKDKGVKEMYECRECKVLCSTLDGLAMHMMVHEQKVVIMRHGSTKHLTRIGFTCNVCQKVFGRKGNLVKHQIVHMGIKPYKCDKCDKEFTLKGNLEKHELIHMDRKAHECQICLRKFTLKGNLQQHILAHTTWKFFQCYLCNKEFTLKGNLDKHIKRHANGLPVAQTERKARKQNLGVDLDECAEAEEVADFVKGITVVDNKTCEYAKLDALDTDDTEIGDVVQNL